MDASSNEPAPESQIATLRALRLDLLRLHKALLETERIRYEKTHGRIPGPVQFLGLISNDPFFAWLRPLTSLIVQFDEKVDARDPTTAAEARNLLEETRALIEAQDGAEFQLHYDRALQASPDVVILHTKAQRHLR